MSLVSTRQPLTSSRILSRLPAPLLAARPTYACQSPEQFGLQLGQPKELGCAAIAHAAPFRPACLLSR